MQAIRATRAGGHVGYVGVTHDVQIPGIELFFAGIHLLGGPAPVRRFLPELIQLIWDRKIDPGKVFDLTLPLEQAAEGYKAMDERRATKVLLTLDHRHPETDADDALAGRVRSPLATVLTALIVAAPAWSAPVAPTTSPSTTRNDAAKEECSMRIYGDHDD